METLNHATHIWRFGLFEVDARREEVRRAGNPVKIREQPFRILVVLLDRPGAIVTREELRHVLWPSGVFVDFDHSLNTAVMKLREALGDTADQPLYIETIPKKGYRFVAPVEAVAMPAVDSAFEAGQAISHYRLLGQIGNGGMSVLYKAKDTLLGRTAALKFPSECLRSDAAMLDRFRREARTASALNHPNICTLYEVGEYRGFPFIAMEYLEGNSLREVLRDRGQALETERIVDYSMQIGAGLESAHSKDVIHRDLKPGNIFITRDGFAKILDFGLAKISSTHAIAATQTTADDDPLSGPGMMMGTVAYMSPEQTLAKELDARSDLFSFGAVLYEMATGVQPFRGESAAAVIDAILHAEPVAPVRLNPELPQELERIIGNCLEKDRETRYQSATAICADLRRLQRDAASAPPPILPDRAHRRVGPRSAVFAALALAAVVVAWTGWPSAAGVPVVTNIEPITNDGLQKQGVQTDGNRVYFLEQKQNRLWLAEVSPNGGESRPIPTPFDENTLFDIAPDGSKLLFCEVTVTSPTCRFWTLDLPAGTPRRLGSLEGQDAVWSPDGSQLLFAKGSEMWLAQANGLEPRRLMTVEGLPFSQRFSLDRSRIRYTVEGTESSNELWEAKADGSGAHRLLPGQRSPADDYGGLWSPNGRYYVFLRGEEGDVWALPEKRGWWKGHGAAPVQITTGPLGFTDLTFGRDGRTLFAAGQLYRGQLARYDPVTHHTTPYLAGISAGALTFSEDGRWIAYITYPEGALWRCRVDGTEKLQLTSEGAEGPQWSPDGRRIVFNSLGGHGKPARLYMVAADGGTPEQVLPQGEDENSPFWSPDGKQIVFARSPQYADVERVELLTVDLETRKVTPVPGSQGLFSPRWSPDGRWLAALSGDSRKLMLFDVQKQAWTTWFAPPEGFVEWEKWSADSRSLCFALDRTGHFSEWRIHLGEGVPQMIADLTQEPRYAGPGAWGGWIDVAPDGKVLFTRDMSHHEIYALHLSEK